MYSLQQQILAKSHPDRLTYGKVAAEKPVLIYRARQKSSPLNNFANFLNNHRELFALSDAFV